MIDAANVIGSRPTGWWRDRPGAARRFVEQLRQAARQGRLHSPAVVVLEGAARAGIADDDVDGVRVVHAARSGDDAVVAQTAALVAPATPSVARTASSAAGVVVVTADRQLGERVRELGAETVGPSWLNNLLEP